jgi:hypothetical protein
MNKKIIITLITVCLILSFFIVRDIQLAKKLHLEKEYQAWYQKSADKYVDCILQGGKEIEGTDMVVYKCFDERTLYASAEEYAKRNKKYDNQTNGK